MRIEDIGFGGLRLVQDPEGFRYGIDAVLLADFACRISGGFKTAADLGTGNGIVPFLLMYKNSDPDGRTVGIDVQEKSIELARMSAELNACADSTRFFHADVCDIKTAISAAELIQDDIWRGALESGGFDVVTSNPPYVRRGSGIENGSREMFLARQETTADLGDFMAAAARILRRKGSFFLVHRPSRLADIMYLARKHGLEPKTMRMVAPARGQSPNIVLLHCVKGGGKELKVMDELCVYDRDGAYSEAINAIYGR